MTSPVHHELPGQLRDHLLLDDLDLGGGYLGDRILRIEPEHQDHPWLRRRAAADLDHRDEVWNGVLHVVPQPIGRHQIRGSRIVGVLFRAAEAHGLLVISEIQMHDPERGPRNYRVPDVVVCRPEHGVSAGIETAELVVEIRSPRDETYVKLPFYAARAVPEFLVIDPMLRTFELHRLAGREYRVVEPDEDGAVTFACLGIRLWTNDDADDDWLRLTVDGETWDL